MGNNHGTQVALSSAAGQVVVALHLSVLGVFFCKRKILLLYIEEMRVAQFIKHRVNSVFVKCCQVTTYLTHKWRSRVRSPPSVHSTTSSRASLWTCLSKATAQGNDSCLNIFRIHLRHTDAQTRCRT